MKVAKVKYVQELSVACISEHMSEEAAQIAYDKEPFAYAIECVAGIDRAYWLVMTREQDIAYREKIRFIRKKLNHGLGVSEYVGNL